MSTRRERFYLCTLTTRSRSLSRPVQAWTEREAELIFRELLEEEGLGGRGTIAVVELLGGGRTSTALEPSPAC